MSRRCRAFLSGEDFDYGTYGLRPLQHDEFNFGTGLSVAHDILEHVYDDQGRVEDELRAFGGILRVRGAEWREKPGQRYGVLEGLASDFPNTLTPLMDDRESVLPIRPRPFHEDIRENLLDLHNHMLVAFQEEGEQYLPPWLDTEQKINQALQWVDLGYRQAVTRYYEAVRRGVHMEDFFRHLVKCADIIIGSCEGEMVVQIKADPEQYTVHYCTPHTDGYELIQPR